ncbi:MAG: glycosyltransferase [Verrucomicrobia bacterium]|jgi:glycosyltransferase involved in cell wall biosynthesis|nr:glycosyltransferase [Verrucomicrobiota bacterium]MBT7065406.1 glycosyltransferase [Verrucomicrobiota bacterium]MBT7700338.1 glycosyltransferase [Verrucomicrobiota bacterium]
MRFLHINTKDIAGGAARATYRLHQALVAAGHESRILCAVKQLPSDDSSSLFRGRYGWLVNCLMGKISMDMGLGWAAYPSHQAVRSSHWIHEWADVIVLANLHGWFFPLDLLPKITAHIPTIWRLHDMWAGTGFCTYAYDCERQQTGCGKCPHRAEYPSMTIDWTARMWHRKQSIYANLDPRTTLSTPSVWLRDVMQASPLTQHIACEAFPNGIPLQTFRPSDRPAARNTYGFSEKDRVIMFSYASKDDAFRKGDDMLVPVLEGLPPQISKDTVLLLVGDQPKRAAHLPVRSLATGYLDSEEILVGCYNAADVFLNLSRADNLPNCLVEAAACGLPAVTINSGGCGETVLNGKSGFATDTVSATSDALCYILSNPVVRNGFAKEARDFACQHFSDTGYAHHIANLATDLTSESRH